MQLSLLRKEPLLRELTGEELRLLAQLLYEACQKAGYGSPQLMLTASLWGFDRDEGEALRAQLAEDMGEAVRLADPDTLELTSPPVGVTEGALPVGLEGYLEALGELTERPLLLELRLRFRLAAEAQERTFVLHGTLERGAFRLRSIWRTGEGDFQDEVHQFTPWPTESALLRTLYDYSVGKRELTPEFCKELFPDKTLKRVGGLVEWLFLLPSSKAWLQRLGVTLGLFLGIIGLLASGALAVLTPWLLLGALLSLLGFGLVFWNGWRGIVELKTRQNAFHAKSYSAPLVLNSVDLHNEGLPTDDLALGKLTRELEQAGVHCIGDFRPSNLPELMGSFLRLFLREDGTTLALVVLHSVSGQAVRPYKISFLARTELEDGWRVATVNDHAGYRRSVPALQTIARSFKSAKHPLDLLRKHDHILALTEQQRQTRRRALTPEQVLETEIANHERARTTLTKTGYFDWSDALRMRFHEPLPEYLKDEIP